MSTNCVKCISKDRTGGDLLCDDCRRTNIEIGKIVRVQCSECSSEMFVYAPGWEVEIASLKMWSKCPRGHTQKALILSMCRFGGDAPSVPDKAPEA